MHSSSYIKRTHIGASFANRKNNNLQELIKKKEVKKKIKKTYFFNQNFQNIYKTTQFPEKAKIVNVAIVSSGNFLSLY